MDELADRAATNMVRVCADIRSYFIKGTERITDEHRFIRKVRGIRKWDREELTTLKQLTTRAKLLEINQNYQN